MRSILWPLIALVVVLAACGADPASDEDHAPAPIGPGPTAPRSASSTEAPSPPAPLDGLTLTILTVGLDQPTAASSLPGDDRIFIVERAGLIRILRGGVLETEPFLDLSDEVSTGGSEQGLTALAFHPRYRDNGRLFVFFTDVTGDSQVFEYRASPDNPDLADPRSGRRILELEQDHAAHQGGFLLFGPDGYLWVTIGDGGIPKGETDSRRAAQDPSNWYGTVLRLDIDAATPYAIPPDNPFADGVGGSPEVWAYGLRNPWRLTIDEGLAYISDVGQDWWEEINVVPLDDPGANYGWPIMEGPECFEAESCYIAGLTEPTYTEYHRYLCAIIAGPVYRGAAIPELHGYQFYSDYCIGWVRSWSHAVGASSTIDWTEDLGELGNVTSFGIDGSGEMLIMNQAGELYRIDPIRS